MCRYSSFLHSFFFGFSIKTLSSSFSLPDYIHGYFTFLSSAVIIDVRQGQLLFLGRTGTYCKTAHDMRELLVRPQPLRLCPVPSRSASRPLTPLSLANSTNANDNNNSNNTGKKAAAEKDDYRKETAAAPRFGYTLSPVTYQCRKRTHIEIVAGLPGSNFISRAETHRNSTSSKNQ